MDATTIIIILASGIAIILIVFLSKVNMFKSLNLRDAAEAYSLADFARAKSVCDNLLLEDPNNTVILWYLARSLSMMKDHEEAIRTLQRLVAINKYEVLGDDLPSLDGFSEITVHKQLRELLMLTKNQEALFAQNQILMKLEPDNIKYPLAVAQNLAKAQEYSDRMLKFLARALEIDSDNLDALTLAAFCYFKQNNPEKAEQFANKALSLNSNLVDIKYVLGEIMQKRGNLAQAKTYFNQAANSVYYGKSVLYNLARIIEHEGDQDTALEWLQKADSRPVSAQEPAELEWQVKYALANLYEKMNDMKKAAHLYHDISKFNKGYKDVEMKLKQVSLQRVEETDSLKDFQTAKNEIFQIMCEDLIRHLDLKIEKAHLTNDGNMNILAADHGIEPKKIAIFIRRSYEVLQEDQARLLEKYMQTTRATKGMLMSTGGIADSARTFSKTHNIDVFSGDQLSSYLDKTLKANY